MVTNVELDHHSEFALARRARGGVRRAGPARRPHVVRDAPPFDGPLALPGEHNRANAGTALAALELAGVDARRGGAGARAGSPGTGRRFEVSEAGGVTIVDDYAHHPDRARRHDRGRARGVPGPARCACSSSRTSYSRTRHLAGELGAALAAADDVVVTDVYPAREDADRRRDRQARRRRALGPRPRSPAWIPDGRPRPRRTSPRGPSRATCCSSLGAGDVDAAPALLREARLADRR